MTRATLALPLLLLAAATPAARADDARTEAQRHVTRATELHGQGKFAEALGELSMAYSLDPQPNFLYAIAQTHVQLGDCEHAILFYRRFLSTRPERLAADAAREAIDVCEHAPPPPPPPPEATPPPPPDPGPVREPTTTTPPPATVRVVRERAWYGDKLGVALVGGGVLLGAGGAVVYAMARSDLDHAESAPTYAGYLDGLDRARGKRLAAGVLAGAGATLVVVGVVRLARHGERAPDVAIVPTSGGGLVSWAGRF